MDRFRGYYRIPSSRLPNWDYSSDGMYFVTICTKEKMEYFGEVVAGKMVLSSIGDIAQKELLKTEQMRKEILLDTWVIMPNHIHAILMIVNAVETQGFASLRCENSKGNAFKPQSRNLASAIRGYKIGVKMETQTLRLDFHWQPRFYDHVIRDEKSLHEIREYIVNNPKQWEIDEYNRHHVLV